VARPIGALARAVKWARRRPAVAGLSALCLLLSLTAFALVTWKWREAVLAREAEQRQRWLAEQAEGEAQQKARDEAVARRAEEQARAAAEGQLYRSNIGLAHSEWLAGNPGHALELLNECPQGRRRWEWHYLKR
jgi:hypothetical protein